MRIIYKLRSKHCEINICNASQLCSHRKSSPAEEVCWRTCPCKSDFEGLELKKLLRPADNKEAASRLCTGLANQGCRLAE